MVPPCAPSFLSRHCKPRLGSGRAKPGSARNRTLYSGTGRGVSSAGRAPALQAGGHRFDPGTLHQETRWRRRVSFLLRFCIPPRMLCFGKRLGKGGFYVLSIGVAIGNAAMMHTCWERGRGRALVLP
jgi:hypothetical protein